MEPVNLFIYERLGFDASVHYAELSSEESGADTRTTEKASGYSITATHSMANAPGAKIVTNVTTSVPAELLVAARSASLGKQSPATTPCGVPRRSPATTISTTVSVKRHGNQYGELGSAKCKARIRLNLQGTQRRRTILRLTVLRPYRYRIHLHYAS